MFVYKIAKLKRGDFSAMRIAVFRSFDGVESYHCYNIRFEELQTGFANILTNLSNIYL